jgi:hypothetical protein
LHEVAHVRAYHRYGRKINPHGQEWKQTFAELLRPMVSDLIFPEDILVAVKEFIRSPRATSGGNHALAKALNKYNINGGKLLAELEPDSFFTLNKRTFRKGQLRRTRYICKELRSGKSYLISKNAVVMEASA